MERKYVFAVLEGTLNYCGVEIKFEVTYYILRRKLNNHDIKVDITKNYKLLCNIFKDVRHYLGLRNDEYSILHIDDLFRILKEKYYNFPKNVVADHFKVEYKPIKVVPVEELISKILKDIMLEEL